MNILFFSSYSQYADHPVGGAEISLQLIAEKMAKLKETVSYATLGDFVFPGYRKTTTNGIKIYHIKCIRWPYFKGLLFPRQGEQFITYQRRKFLADIIQKEHVDIVHCYDTIMDTYDILKARDKYNLKIKVVKRVSGLFWAYLLRTNRISKQHVEWVFNSVDLINYLTPAFKELVLENCQKYGLNFTPKKEIITDIGINISEIPFCWKPEKKRAFNLVCVARFSSYQKRQDLLIEALSQTKGVPFTVDFIGVGENFGNCKNLCRKLGIEQQCFFHGYLPQKRIYQILSQSDLFVLPTNYEGLPKSLLEAMAIGLPCLVSDTKPLNAYIQDSKNGFLVENTPSQWAKKIGSLYEYRGETSDISQRGREFVELNYDADKNILKYHEEFKNLIK